MYERRTQPLLSGSQFMRRIALHGAIAVATMAVSLAIGMTGYERFEHLQWRDAFLNAAMLLGGMGPVNAPVTNAGKLFAGFYALYSGLVFLLVVGLVLTPILHRVLHRFHWDQDK